MAPTPLLNIVHSPTKGRCIYPTTPLSSGAAVLHALPYALGVLPSHRKRLCAYLPCSLPTTSYYTTSCSGCGAVFYCSIDCKRGNEEKHSWICAGLRRLKGWAKDRHIAGMMVLVLEVLAQAKVDGSPCALEADADSELRAEAFRAVYSMEDADVPVPVPDKPTFAQVLALQSHLSSWSAEDMRTWTQHTHFLHSLFSGCLPGLLPAEWGLGEVLDLVSKLESNSFGLFAGDSNPIRAVRSAAGKVELQPVGEGGRGRWTWTWTGRGLGLEQGQGGPKHVLPEAPNLRADPLTAVELFACPSLPLAGLSHAQEEEGEEAAGEAEKIRTVGLGYPLSFTLIRDVEEEEELTISYVSLDLPRARRRAVLSGEWYFDCGCGRCLEERRGRGRGRGSVERVEGVG
ncbi:hypothetical protein DACRYDRAFT_108715 [Dacryopinax primogenitus]|uniref:MYND-type domain-containing protein n=1 Tax=Dacryopinax primogenitus (strain DJM 731) TaxID=1858805 RepID=M5G9X5_DACPD|nr:uncharacterized protein DACRYDRAFT_108715 [Dacryopinax primogenitus]EJU00643.1 hypothetical protein DACRYDRAFT_108715 [Dacryopinax primogenitus]